MFGARINVKYELRYDVRVGQGCEALDELFWYPEFFF